jgi:hypothetical protein
MIQCYHLTHQKLTQRVEADISFASAPGRLGWDWRQVIADERAWRAPLWPVDTTGVAVLGGRCASGAGGGQIAGLCRALRKGRKDAKDEPGAADFYRLSRN